MGSTVLQDIPKNIKKFRLANKMTQERLAEKLNLDTQYYAQLERGERNFTLDKIIRICELFQIQIDDIIDLHYEDHTANDNTEIINRMLPYLKTLSVKQLASVEKFIIDITPYIK